MPWTPHPLITSAHGPVGDHLARTNKRTGRTSFAPRRRTTSARHAVCGCKLFRLADTFYKAAGPAYYVPWAAALVRPRMSSYDLYMKEALTLMNAGYSAPHWPGPSGGWTTHAATPGPTFYPHPCAVPAPGQVVTGWFRWRLLPFPTGGLYCNYEHHLEDQLQPEPFPVTFSLRAGYRYHQGDWMLEADDVPTYNDVSVPSWKTAPTADDVDPIAYITIDTGTAAHHQSARRDARNYLPLDHGCPAPPLYAAWNTRRQITLHDKLRLLHVPAYSAHLDLALRGDPAGPGFTRWRLDADLDLDIPTGQPVARPLFWIRALFDTTTGEPHIAQAGQITAPHLMHADVRTANGSHNLLAEVRLFVGPSTFKRTLTLPASLTWTFPPPVDP